MLDILFIYDVSPDIISGIGIVALSGFGAGVTLFFGGFAVRALWAAVKKFM